MTSYDSAILALILQIRRAQTHLKIAVSYQNTGICIEGCLGCECEAALDQLALLLTADCPCEGGDDCVC